MTDLTTPIDWNDVWRKQMEAHNRVVPMDCSSIWHSKAAAQKFWEMTQKNSEKRLGFTLDRLELDDAARILDVGAGPGNLAIPLALKFSHVTAVEPAKGMIRVLKENAARKKIENITPVRKKWEAFDVAADLEAPCDLVIASFSLGMPDMKEAILKMADASSKYVCLFWFAGEPEWEKHSRALWFDLHNIQYLPSPKADVLFNLLYQMGIYPEMSVFPLSSETVFASLEDAVRQFAPRYRVENQNQENILTDYLEQALEKREGQWVQRNHSIRVKLWWST